jgi:hypothetical protein
MKTREQYLNKEVSHHDFFAQFVTERTKAYILKSLKVEDIKRALENGDKHLNEIKIPYNNLNRANGSWWWDGAPINTKLVREAGENLSQSTYTCVAKAAARILAMEK